MERKRSSFLTILVVLLLGGSMLLNLLFVLGSIVRGVPGEMPKFEERLVVPGDALGREKIAIVPLRGIISGMEPGGIGETMVEDVKLQLRQAVNDETVKAVVLHVDSPGGEVTASDSIYQAVRETREKKPVVVYMGSLAASGGYYVACGGTHLIANPTTFTGSIGVIMQTISYHELSEKLGVRMVTFKSGAMKDMLSGSRAITDEERNYVQGMIGQTYDRFLGIVAEERKLPADQLRTGLADGRVITGKDAFDAKLIDQLGTVEDAYAKAKELGKAPNARVVRYESYVGLLRMLRLLGQPAGKKTVEVDVLKPLIPKIEAGRLYYLPSIYAP